MFIATPVKVLRRPLESAKETATDQSRLSPTADAAGALAALRLLLGGKDDYTPASNCLAYADELRARGASVRVVVYPDANHAFDSDAPPHFRPQPTTIRDCHGMIDLDAGAFTVEAGGQTLSGKAAAAALRQCTERGVTVGDDPEAREKAPQEVADFLKPIFDLAR